MGISRGCPLLPVRSPAKLLGDPEAVRRSKISNFSLVAFGGADADPSRFFLSARPLLGEAGSASSRSAAETLNWGEKGVGRGFRGTRGAAVWFQGWARKTADEGQRGGAGRWAQRCFKAGRTRREGSMEKGRGGQLPEEEHQKGPSRLYEGERTSLFLPALGVTKEGKRTAAFLIKYGREVGRMKKLRREGSAEGTPFG